MIAWETTLFLFEMGDCDMKTEIFFNEAYQYYGEPQKWFYDDRFLSLPAVVELIEKCEEAREVIPKIEEFWGEYKKVFK